MDTVTAIANILVKIAGMGPTVIQGVQDATPFAQAIAKAFGGGELTEVEITALEARIDALSAELQEPLPAPQPGDPDYVAPVPPTTTT